MEYYLDTCIWLDFIEKRGDNGEHALKLLHHILEGDHVILYSELHFREMEGAGYSQEQIRLLFKSLPFRKLRRAYLQKDHLNEARKIAHQRNIPKKDALHAVLARDNRALLISTDQHFSLLKDIVETKKPQVCY